LPAAVLYILPVNHMILSHDNLPIGYIVVIEFFSVLTF